MSFARVESWVGPSGARDFAETNFRALSSSAFALHRHTRSFDAVAVIRTTCRALTYVNPGSSTPGPDSIHCVFVESGDLSLEAGASQRLTSDHVAFLPTAHPYRLTSLVESSMLAIRVPGDSVASMLPGTLSAAKVVSRRPGLMTAVHEFANACTADTPNLTAIESYATGQLLAEMVGALLLEQIGGADEPTRNAAGRLRDRAMAVIAQRRSESELSLADVAADVSVSPRRLQAAFAEASTTVTTELRRLRAALAAHLLSTPRYDVLSIADVARDSGFGSAVTMRRALQEFHATSPSMLRRRLETAPPAARRSSQASHIHE